MDSLDTLALARRAETIIAATRQVANAAPSPTYYQIADASRC